MNVCPHCLSVHFGIWEEAKMHFRRFDYCAVCPIAVASYVCREPHPPTYWEFAELNAVCQSELGVDQTVCVCIEGPGRGPKRMVTARSPLGQSHTKDILPLSDGTHFDPRIKV